MHKNARFHIALAAAVMIMGQAPAVVAAPGDLFVDRGTVFYINQLGEKRPFDSEDVFFANGFEFSQARPAAPADLALPLGPVMTYPRIERSGVLGASTASLGGLIVNPAGTVYYINYLGQRRAFSSAEVFLAHGFKFLQVRKATIDDYLLPLGSEMTFPDGTLLKVKNDPTIYVIKKGQKRAFSSATAFTSRGYSDQNVIVLPNQKLLASYPAGNDYSTVAGINTRDPEE